MLAKQLGGVSYLSEQKERELLELKQKWGYSDPRLTKEYENCDICANSIFRDSWSQSGVERRAFDAPPAMPASGNGSTAAVPKGATSTGATNGSIDTEALIRLITDRVVQELKLNA
jgi:L-fuculose-phosphate aldolase